MTTNTAVAQHLTSCWQYGRCPKNGKVLVNLIWTIQGVGPSFENRKSVKVHCYWCNQKIKTLLHLNVSTGISSSTCSPPMASLISLLLQGSPQSPLGNPFVCTLSMNTKCLQRWPFCATSRRWSISKTKGQPVRLKIVEKEWSIWIEFLNVMSHINMIQVCWYPGNWSSYATNPTPLPILQGED